MGMAASSRDLEKAGFVQHVVALRFGTSLQDIQAATRRTASAAFARQVAMYLTHVAYELSLSRVADAFGRDRTTISHACHLIEDMRDDYGFDHQLEILEGFLRGAPIFSETSQVQ